MAVLAPARQMSLALALAEIGDRPAKWAGLGQWELAPFRLVLVAGTKGFDSLSGGRVPSWGAGMTLPGRRTVVIRVDGGDPAATLHHELAHLVFHDAVRVRVPLWFDEGYAVVAAEEWSRLEGLRLNLAVAVGKVPELGGLDAALRGGSIGAEAGYALAGTAVRHLARLQPAGTLDSLVRRLRDHEAFEDAVLASTGRTLEQFEISWRADVRRRYGLGLWVVAGGGWAVLAVVLVGAAWFRRRADRPRREALDIGWEVAAPSEETEVLDPTRLDS